MDSNNKYSYGPRYTLLLYLFLFSAVVVLITGYTVFSHQLSKVKIDKHRELSSITSLKVSQLEQWRTERLSEVNFFTATYPFSSYIKSIMEGDTSVSGVYRKSLKAIMSNGRYSNIFIADRNGFPCFSVYSKGLYMDSVSKGYLARVFNSKQILSRDFFYCETHGKVHSQIIAPVMDTKGNVYAAVVFLNDPTQHIFPLIESWPVWSRSAEVVVARRERERVKLLNNLRFEDNTSMGVSLSLTDSSLIETSAVLGKRGFADMVDYSGQRVLGDISEVPGTDWVVIVKVSVNELLSDFYKRSALVAIVIVLTLLLIAFTLSRFSLSRQRKFYKELAKNRNQLENSEERLRMLLDSTAEGIFGVDSKGICTFCNNAALKMLGYSMEEQVLGLSFHDLIHHTDIDGNGHPWYRCQINKTLTKKIEVHVTDDIFYRRDGSYFPAEYWSYPVHKEHTVKGAVITFMDITQKKYDQNVQQMLYEIARQSMTYIKIEELLQLVKLELGRVMDSSNLYVALISQTTGRLEPVQISGNEMVWPENQEQLEMARLILEKGRSMVLNEKEMDDFAMQNGLETKNSAKACLCVPIKDSDKSRGILILKSYKSPDAYDLQKSRLAEMVARELSLILQKEATMNEMKTAKERAEESDRLKSAFLSNISHEIRTPMNGILGFMELLSEPGLDEGQREEYLALMEKSGKRLLDTINAIVEVSKIEAGQLQVNLNIVDCNEIMDFHYNFFERQIVGKGLEFIKGKSIPKENSIIYSDQFKLEAILTNLINNAMKFTNEGFIEFGNYMEEDQLCFYVKDTGIGIPKDKMDSVFNRFVQADSHFSRPYEGSGLGLSIVKGYVESINGKIFLESEEGKGTLFTFKIPYIPGKIAEDTD